jgi:hypothetical protein
MSFNLSEMYNNGSSDSGGGGERTPFLTIKESGGKRKIQILVDFDELKVELIHPRVERPDGKTSDLRCIGKKNGCPLCLGDQRVQKRAYIPVLDVEAKQAMILPISLGKNMANIQNLGLFYSENNTIKDVVWIFTRTGVGLATTYSFMPGKQTACPETDIPDIEALIARIPDSTMMLQASSGGAGKKGSLDDELGFLTTD